MGRVLMASALWTESCWQAESGELSAVLCEVFGWLSGRELAACGAVCRAWRAAAADPQLWRRLLRSLGVTNTTLKTLRDHCPSLSWRQEYINICSGWELVARLPPEAEGESEANEHPADTPRRGGGGTPLAHAALDDAGTRLALAADDGAFSIWERTSGTWHEEWGADLRARGWLGAVRSAWAAGEDAPRLLVTGALALADRWELLVLQRDEFGAYCRQARAGCSPGAGGSWAGADAFLSFELMRLAARLAMTVVWLNAATQETQSEYTGVTTPLLRVFNEDSAHLTHALVADVPLEELKITDDVVGEELSSLNSSYYSASYMKTLQLPEESVKTLVTASHGPGGALRSWAMRARRPPPLRAADAGSLAARARRRRQSAADPPPEPEEPDEATVRAMCDPPDAECYLHAAILGLVQHFSGRCVWAMTADGQAWCVSLPALARLCRLPGAPGAFPSDHYYIQPATSRRYVAAPAACSRDSRVRLWSALSGAPCPQPPLPAYPSSSALVCLLPPREDELLVLAGHSLFRQPGPALAAGCRGVRSAPVGTPPCSGPPPPRICPCTPRRPPPCRASPSDRQQATKFTCCPPPQGKRPPCAPRPKKPPMTCSQRKLSYSAKLNSTEKNGGCCGKENDRVAQRLAEAERVRRENYEREVRERRAAPAARPERPRYCLGGERECSRATDGRQYAVLCGKEKPEPKCGPGRTPPPPQCLEVLPDGPCKLHNVHLDPCAHRPRTMLHIDRSQSKCIDKNQKKKIDDKACEMKRSPLPAPPCRHPTLLEGLRQRGPGPCAGEQKMPPPSHAIHTLTAAFIGQRDVENTLKVPQNEFSTYSKCHFILDENHTKINRATSPLCKRMSSNSCDKNKDKKGSWQSLKQMCESLRGGKKIEKPKSKGWSSSCKPPPPCKPVTPTQHVPPNPCAPKKKTSETKDKSCPTAAPRPCANKQLPAKPLKNETQCPCNWKSVTPQKSSPIGITPCANSSKPTK